MAIIESIVSQHAEEAAFLWLLRRAAVSAPHYSVKDLAELDDRVEAHVDGLRVSGDEGWPFCEAGLDFEESGEVFAAGVIALEGDDAARIRKVYETVEAAPETVDGLVSAMGWTPRDKLQGKVAGLLGSEAALWRRVGISACAVHRVDCQDYLTRAVEDPDPALRARALRAAGETARLDLLQALRRQFTAESEACAFWSAWSALLLGDRGAAVERMGALALASAEFASRAAATLPRALPASHSRDWLKQLATMTERRRDLIIACGATGDPDYIPWLIQQMAESPDHARIAGEAFTFITGVDLAYDDLETDWPEGFEAGPTENPEDGDVAMDPDEDLPWPDPALIEAWWHANQERFTSGSRYLVGAPISAQHCQHVLRGGMQRQRIAAALELALMEPRAMLFETRAPGFRQQAALKH